MRVLINALSVPSCRQGGAGFYTSTLIDGLSRTDGLECLALASERVGAELEELAPDASVVTAPERPRGRPRKALNQLFATRWPWTLDLGFDGEAPEAEIVHWPIAFMNGPNSKTSARRVLTIHDLQHEFFPEFFSRRDRLLRRLRWKPSAQAADHVLTISEFSRRTICERFDLSPQKVTAVHLARRPTLDPDTKRTKLLKGLDLLSGPWVVYPASPLPAKNHIRLLDALSLCRSRSPDVPRLVLIGPTMHSWRPIEGAIAERALENRVLRLGHVDERTLAAIYSHANGLIFPSLFEGFGLPVLEAMSAGCPIAVSNAGSLSEIAGGVGSRFSPYEVEEIAAALTWLSELGEEERQKQGIAGRERAAQFSLKKMLNGTRAVYDRLR